MHGPGKLSVIVAGLILATLLAPQTQAGTIKGTVSVEGIRSAGNIAVYLDTIPGQRFDPPADHIVINQIGMAFVPHVAVILQGTTVDFLNSDAVAHNVYWPSLNGDKKLGTNLGTWSEGEKRSFAFLQVGVVALLCNAHPNMSGYLIVVPTPYFAVTDKTGNFEIPSVPSGQYTLKTWSEEGQPVTQSVTVTEETITVNMTTKKSTGEVREQERRNSTVKRGSALASGGS